MPIVSMGGAAQSVLRLSIPCIAGTRGARFGMLFSRIYLEMQIRLKLLGLVIGKFVRVKKVKSEPKKQNGIYPEFIVIVC
jgi:hypothetical protein